MRKSRNNFDSPNNYNNCDVNISGSNYLVSDSNTSATTNPITQIRKGVIFHEYWMSAKGAYVYYNNNFGTMEYGVGTVSNGGSEEGAIVYTAWVLYESSQDFEGKTFNYLRPVVLLTSENLPSTNGTIYSYEY